jgi:hypothetical protein
MIVHIVFFKLKNYPEGLKELQENIMSLKGKINEIRDFYIGEDISRADRSYDLALYSTFDTKKDLGSYAVNEDHLKVIQNYVNVYCEKTRVVDFEK